MNYFTDLFTPDTWNKFREHGARISGYPLRQLHTAEQLVPGDLLCCYLTRLSRWCGILEVRSAAYQDSAPIFMDPDPYVVRFKVEPIVMLDFENAIPIFEDMLWSKLTITRSLEKRASRWAGSANLRNSLRRLAEPDGELIVSVLKEQSRLRRVFQLSGEDERRLAGDDTVRSATKSVIVEIPEDSSGEEEEAAVSEQAEIPRESIQVQATLARLGIEMGFDVWLPRNDKQAILSLLPASTHDHVLAELPLNYNDVTLRTIEQIDVIWLRKRSIARAFEVEHTTAIYSGLLRMADLLALQPNMDIRLHIVAPDDKRNKVLREIKRPVFSLLDKGPLYESCSYLSYSAVNEIAQMGHLRHMSDTVIDDFETYAQEE